MQGRLFLISIAAAMMAVPALAGTPVHSAPLLPEVESQMDKAYNCMNARSLGEAVAHAELVLVGQQVTYSLRFSDMSTQAQKRCTDAFVGAAKSWESELEGSVHFRQSADPATADVAVSFKPCIEMRGQEIAGYVNWKRTITTSGTGDIKWKYHANMQIRTVNVDQAPMSFESMRHAAMHELGHVLGLDDSDQQGDVMGPLNVRCPVTAPKPHEVMAVHDLRIRAEQLRDDALYAGLGL